MRDRLEKQWVVESTASINDIGGMLLLPTQPGSFIL